MMVCMFCIDSKLQFFEEVYNDVLYSKTMCCHTSALLSRCRKDIEIIKISLSRWFSIVFQIILLNHFIIHQNSNVSIV